MTQDFKDKILKYLTGNIEEDSGINEPQFGAVETITNNLYQYMMDNFDTGGSLPYIIDIIKGNQNDNYLCYGQGYSFGFIIILDSNFEVIEGTNTYTSGTTMNKFIRLNQAPNGTFYGIDNNGANYRFIMLNNILLKTPNQPSYRYVMQKTYNITSNYPSSFTLINITKNPNGGNYFIYGSRLVSSHMRPCAIEYTINVGSSNEWTQYDYTIGDSNSYNITGGWASWDNQGNITFRLIGRKGTSTNTNVYVYGNSGSAISLLNTYDTGINTSSIGQFDALLMSSVILSEDNAYVIAYEQTNTPKIHIFRINNGIQKLYESSNYSGVLGQFMPYGISTDYVNTYFWYLVPSGSYYDFYGGLIIESNVYQALITNTDFYNLTMQISFNQFNLYSFNLQSGNTVYKIPFVFNQFNYNGLPYEDINCIKPNSGILYDSNNKVIFARNLYNLNINGNTTISTIEVPNTFLNDETIATEDLLSETNVVLNNNVQNISKNIYEVLDINFFNTLVMKNSNNPLNEIINNEGASRINSSVSQLLDYQNAKATKVKINYQDGTTNIFGCDFYPVGNFYRVKFSLYANKEINNIEIISNDENTSYQTIEGTFNVGSTYTITQDVYIDNKEFATPVYYNQDEVYYNDEQVYY